MKLSFLFFGNQPDEKWPLCQQMGIKTAIAKLAPELTGDPAIDDFASFARSKQIFNDHGFELYGLEGDQFPMQRIKLGLPGREDDVERYCRMLENMGRLGVKLLCYNFMATGWFRTRVAERERGDALVSRFVYTDDIVQQPTPYGNFSEAQIWENYQWFLERVLPAAEAAGVTMGLHPDDPPISPVQGIARVFTSDAAMERALSFSDSPAHQITFCQGTFTTMQEDVLAMIKKYGARQKIAFVHIRDVVGTPADFRETFHDNGPTDMFAAMKLYKEIGFTGPLRSDHVPTMAGESNEHFGYGMQGNLFGIGYIKGLMHGAGIAPQ
ncbi:mannonate dehydratase [Neolewinella lacunae]|uniref:mannonate dehydratase n=1 Tax=Neolewinella lacunae TaxID=1517758 RepID=A0A923PNY1_9BACT|nr:mannonate dehydratase [Neolewinella lacunae]MBC6995146.1 mannonate dehydratase [Neolewinella lacunae]MDN3634096.1 mannonate dehydratase [Neolewinella lacunae]